MTDRPCPRCGTPSSGADWCPVCGLQLNPDAATGSPDAFVVYSRGKQWQRRQQASDPPATPRPSAASSRDPVAMPPSIAESLPRTNAPGPEEAIGVALIAVIIIFLASEVVGCNALRENVTCAEATGQRLLAGICGYSAGGLFIAAAGFALACVKTANGRWATWYRRCGAGGVAVVVAYLAIILVDTF